MPETYQNFPPHASWNLPPTKQRSASYYQPLYPAMLASNPHSPVVSRRAFTLIELLIVIAIIALLAAILFPVFSRARESARRSSCVSNLKQIAIGMHQYTQDYDERLPVDRTNMCADPTTQQITYMAGETGTCGAGLMKWFWPDLIYPYVKNAQVFNDPSNVNKYFDGASYHTGTTTIALNAATAPSAPASTYTTPWVYQGPYSYTLDPNDNAAREGIAYGYNRRYGEKNYHSGVLGKNGHIGLTQFPAETMMIAESSYFRIMAPTGGSSWTNYCGQLMPRHFQGINIAFADGHVKWTKWDDVCGANPVNASAPSSIKKLWLPDYAGP